MKPSDTFDDLAYDMNEKREEYFLHVAKMNLVISLPEDDELQLDIDSPEQMTVFERSFAILKRQFMCFDYGFSDLQARVTPSKSGAPGHCHVRIKMPFPLTTYERIAWQAALGSDPVRELLSCVRAKNNCPMPTLLVEKPE